LPIIEYNSVAKINLIGELYKSNYIFYFKKLQCSWNTNVIENTLNIDITSIYRNVYNVVWEFVVFQTNRFNNQLKDNSIFDHVNVRNLWMEIDGERYPEESWDLDSDNNNYCLRWHFPRFQKNLD
jgi:hypothetical protein